MLEKYNDINFCQRCGSSLGRTVFDRIERPYCKSCDLIVFTDPKLAAGSVFTLNDQIVLVQRGVEPQIGKWSLPAGFVERGEKVEDAAVREAKEETGLDIEVLELLGLYSYTGSMVALAVYGAKFIGGTLTAGSDALDAQTFSTNNLPELAFGHTEMIIKTWAQQN